MPNQIGQPARPAAGATPRQIIAGAVGNVLEWYDFAAYGYFAGIFGRNFFPGTDAVASLAAAFGVFAAAFLMRPIGGVLFGHIGDRLGRRRALLLSAGLMTISTVAMGLLPTYAAIGTAAPALLVALRLLQGGSVGGEYATSVVFLVEQCKPHRRGLIGSMAPIGASFGTILGSAIGALVASLLTTSELQVWGWRIPFLLGIALGGSAILMRRTMVKESPPRVRPGSDLPLIGALRRDWREIVRGFFLCASFAVSFYLAFVYLTTYIQQVEGLPAGRALQINTVSMLVMIALTPCFAMLSDRIGRKQVLVAATLGMVILPWPLFTLLMQRDEALILLGQCGISVLVAAYSGAIPATLVEMFKTPTRCTALSISYNAAFAVLGGTSPIVAVYLVSHEHIDSGPALYLMASGAVSLAAALTLRDRTGRPLAT